MKKVAIPNPCSEDWNLMTPTEKGAYCDKCAFEVIDFTRMSNDDIKQYLTKNSSKRTCGHIEKGQLETINSNYHIWDTQSTRTFKSKFLYACLMVFGMALFTGCEYIMPEEDHPVGMVEFVEGEMIIEDDSLSTCSSDLDSLDNTVKGKMEYSED